MKKILLLFMIFLLPGCAIDKTGRPLSFNFGKGAPNLIEKKKSDDFKKWLWTGEIPEK